jgi:hypothetical protein
LEDLGKKENEIWWIWLWGRERGRENRDRII